MPGLMKKLYSPAALDVLFAIAGVFSVFSLYRLAATPIPPIATAVSPGAKVAALVAVVVVSGLAATVTTRIDQLSADDFAFDTLTKSALMGLMGFFFASAAWYMLLVKSFGAISSFSMVMLALACWSVGYLITRFRGTRA